LRIGLQAKTRVATAKLWALRVPQICCNHIDHSREGQVMPTRAPCHSFLGGASVTPRQSKILVQDKTAMLSAINMCSARSTAKIGGGNCKKRSSKKRKATDGRWSSEYCDVPLAL
jgi:hypothetical protein